LDGTNLAIKLLNTQSHQNIDDFLNEVVSITGIKHKNLVKLKGCCLHGTQRLLVYELVEKENLAKALWGTSPFFYLHCVQILTCNKKFQ